MFDTSSLSLIILFVILFLFTFSVLPSIGFYKNYAKHTVPLFGINDAKFCNFCKKLDHCNQKQFLSFTHAQTSANTWTNLS
jgi:hypothetical protein